MLSSVTVITALYPLFITVGISVPFSQDQAESLNAEAESVCPYSIAVAVGSVIAEATPLPIETVIGSNAFSL